MLLFRIIIPGGIRNHRMPVGQIPRDETMKTDPGELPNSLVWF